MVRRLVLLALFAASGCGKKAASSSRDAAAVTALAVVDAGVATDAAADAAPVVAPGDKLVVTPLAPKPGTKATSGFEAELDFDLDFGGMQTITSTKQSKMKTIAIVSVDPDGTVHKRITYTKRDTKIVIDGDPHKDASAVRGKTFLVSWKDGVVDVRRKNGAKASDEEIEGVRKEEGQLQSPDLIGHALAGIELVKGQPFEVPAPLLGALAAGEYKPQRVVLTYRGTENELARIYVEAELSNPDDAGVRMYIDITGTLALDSTGWCREVEAQLKVRAELNNTVVGSGKGIGKVTTSALR